MFQCKHSKTGPCYECVSEKNHYADLNAEKKQREDEQEYYRSCCDSSQIMHYEINRAGRLACGYSWDEVRKHNEKFTSDSFIFEDRVRSKIACEQCAKYFLKLKKRI